jgi:hypothetical protein
VHTDSDRIFQPGTALTLASFPFWKLRVMRGAVPSECVDVWSWTARADASREMRLLFRTSCAALGLTGTSAALYHSRTSAPSRRSVEVVVPATRFGATDIPGKEHWRIIGTKDVDDNGTQHGIAALDPFIFLDESLNPAGVGGLGNGKHPHAGLSAFTYLSPDLEGTESGLIHAWDNMNGDVEPHRAGSIYIINAGRGALLVCGARPATASAAAAADHG